MLRPLVIGHRGASGYRPEHTLESYRLAIEQGADYIEPDLVMTCDGVLVARHENEISGTTDIAAHPEFSTRRCTRFVDGEPVTGWFTEDFTLAELKTLRARERLPALRKSNTFYDGVYEIPTFAEILSLLADMNATRATKGLPAIGVYPETKHPSHFASMGLPLESALLATLDAGARSTPVFIQSFEAGNLLELRRRTRYRLVRLAEDMAVLGDLAEVATYADAIGVAKSMVAAVGPDGRLASVTPLVEEAHRLGLAVHVWTFRAENEFLPPSLRSGSAPEGKGQIAAEIASFLDAGIDGLFIDQPDIGRAAVDAWRAPR